MSGEHLAEVDQTLLLIAEARERAERAARAIRQDDEGSSLVEALQVADRGLLELHNELRKTVYFGGGSGDPQLKLASGS
ncbi:MAG TPA: hypothetical protein VD704_14110 [Gaiellaceae bacterium]|nr:hypothetical protein [Gaiellaceae bacterium]